MPCGRKAGNSLKGGGFGKSLGAHSKKYGKSDAYRVPNPARVTELSFKNEPKPAESVLEPEAISDLVNYKLRGTANLVETARRTKKPIQIIQSRPHNVATSLCSSLKVYSIPTRGFDFRHCSTRVLEFAMYLGRFCSAFDGEKDICDSSGSTEELDEEDDSDESRNDSGVDSDELDSDLVGEKENKGSRSISKEVLGVPHKLLSQVTEKEALKRATEVTSGSMILKALISYVESDSKNLTAFLTRDNLNRFEYSDFCAWRNKLEIERDHEAIMSPFEKNLDFWRELWHTVEKSDIILEIVDSRNPLLFHSGVLERWVTQDMHKDFRVILNKADYLSAGQRKIWQEYFTEKGISCTFYSALRELNHRSNAQKLAQKVFSAPTGADEQSLVLSLETESDWSDVVTHRELTETLQTQAQADILKRNNRHKLCSKFLDTWESLVQSTPVDVKLTLLTKLNRIASAMLAKKVEKGRELDKEAESVRKIGGDTVIHQFFGLSSQGFGNAQDLVVGTIGFPNVGKSSVINSLISLGQRAAISQTPGKTRHIQSFKVPNSDLMLCDCPGLVMPLSNRSKDELVINGIINVDTHRGSLINATSLILARVSERIIEIFGLREWLLTRSNGENIELSRISTEVVEKIAIDRGYISAGRGGSPDLARTSTMLIKAYISGGLISFSEMCPSSPSLSWWLEEEATKWEAQRAAWRLRRHNPAVAH